MRKHPPLRHVSSHVVRVGNELITVQVRVDMSALAAKMALPVIQSKRGEASFAKRAVLAKVISRKSIKTDPPKVLVVDADSL